MDKIYIGFSTHNGSIFSKCIRLAEGSEYSHVYIRKVSKYGEYIYQASGLAVNFMNFEIFKKSNTIVEEYEFELSILKKEKLLSFFIKYAGAGYELKSILKIAAIIAAKKIGFKLKFKSTDDSKFICSELGAFFCREILEIRIDDQLDFITPKALNPIVALHGKKIV